MNTILFNKPYLSGKELIYIEDAIKSGKISGNGKYTQLCHRFFQDTFKFNKCLLTSSCTDALEMAALLLEIAPGDEVIIPSYTFVSTANAFVLRGAKIVFMDSHATQPNLDEGLLEALITPRTRAIVVVHYAGVACNMDVVMELADKHGLYVVEDAAQAIDSYYVGKNGRQPLGGIGHLAAFSFHETKNINAGEGGMLVINDLRFNDRAEIIWEKGTNRSAFWRGDVNKYGWVDIGSSFLPSEITAAYLYAQLEEIQFIQTKRINIWNTYQEGLKILAEKGHCKLPVVPNYATNNAHMFYLICKNLEQRNLLIDYLKKSGVLSVFHYLSLHKSLYFSPLHDGRQIANSDVYSDTLVRLPLYVDLSSEQVAYIVNSILIFFYDQE